MPLKFIKSQFGNDLLLHCGFVYRKQSAHKQSTYWSCTKDKTTLTCPGRCTTIGDECRVTAEHNHLVCPEETEVRYHHPRIKKESISIEDFALKAHWMIANRKYMRVAGIRSVILLDKLSYTIERICAKFRPVFAEASLRVRRKRLKNRLQESRYRLDFHSTSEGQDLQSEFVFVRNPLKYMEASMYQFPESIRSIGVVGGGVMAKAILFPLFDNNLLEPAKVTVFGNSPENLDVWYAKGCSITANGIGKALESTDIILWSVKPQIFRKAVATIHPEIYITDQSDSDPLHISVMAGITVSEIVQSLQRFHSLCPRVVRTMPNIAHRVHAGSTVYAAGDRVSSSDKDLVQSLFSPTGTCLEIPEVNINVAGTLIGSGIGFMFPILEALSDGGVKMGLNRNLALVMAAQAMKGAAELFIKEGTHPGILKDAVCSPGGSTIAGIAELEKNAVRSALINAVEATTKRAEELGQKKTC